MWFLFSGEIADYFGIKIAFYFCWLGHYTTALCIPAAVGLSVWVRKEEGNCWTEPLRRKKVCRACGAMRGHKRAYKRKGAFS